MNRTVMFLSLIALAGCGHKPASVVPNSIQWSDAVADDTMWRDFKKVYHLQITPQVSLEMTAKYSPWLAKGCDDLSCTFYFKLRQSDDSGKWVDFDCDAVAERIIQTSLVPLVQSGCISLRDQGKQFWNNNPDPKQFTDREGHIWTRN